MHRKYPMLRYYVCCSNSLVAVVVNRQYPFIWNCSFATLAVPIYFQQWSVVS